MRRAIILNSKEVKLITAMITEQFGLSFGKEYAYIENSKGKIFIVTKEISTIDIDSLRTDRFGLYIGERGKTQIRLSMEGAQLLAALAKKRDIQLKNVIEISKDELKQYFNGEKLPRKNETENKLVLLSYNGNIIGCSSLKEGDLFNYMPKIHRGTVIV